MARLYLSRSQILAYRQLAGSLDRRLEQNEGSLRSACWTGLQDSSPYAALHSIHARVEETGSETWEHPSLVQLWGPRHTAYLIAKADIGVFSLGRQPDDIRRRKTAEALADRLSALLNGQERTYVEVGRELGMHPNRLRYAATTGRVLIRWFGSGQPTIRTVPPPKIEPSEARLELARRYTHVFGPTTPEDFAKWAGIPRRHGHDTFDQLDQSLTPVRTPIGEAWILNGDVPAFQAASQRPAPARLLPSGDPYFLLWDTNRDLLLPDPAQRNALWPSRVWPGALLVNGDIVGTWRRTKHNLYIEPWRRLSQREWEAVETEAISLPIPGTGRETILGLTT